MGGLTKYESGPLELRAGRIEDGDQFEYEGRKTNDHTYNTIQKIVQEKTSGYEATRSILIPETQALP